MQRFLVTHFLVLGIALAISGFPSTAFTQPEFRVEFELHFVQATPGARAAVAATLTNRRPNLSVSNAPTALDVDSVIQVHKLDRNGAIRQLLDVERQNQALEILGAPTLLTRPGVEAPYLIGGRIPVPTVQSGTPGNSTGGPSPKKRDFGIKLGFIPYLLADVSRAE